MNKEGRYEKPGIEAIEAGELEFSGNRDMAIISLKVLDTIVECDPELPVKQALTILEDAKDLLIQLLGI